MAKERTSVRMQAQIKILSEQGHSIRSIARILRLSRRTVRKFLEPAPQPAAEDGGWMATVDWEYVRQEVYGKGTTVKQIQREVAPDIAYVKIWRAFREQVGRQASPGQVTIRLDHKPAEKSQVDFCDGLFITDRVTGNKTLTQFFLGVLPFSSYFFVRGLKRIDHDILDRLSVRKVGEDVAKEQPRPPCSNRSDGTDSGVRRDRDRDASDDAGAAAHHGPNGTPDNPLGGIHRALHGDGRQLFPASSRRA